MGVSSSSSRAVRSRARSWGRRRRPRFVLLFCFARFFRPCLLEADSKFRKRERGWHLWARVAVCVPILGWWGNTHKSHACAPTRDTKHGNERECVWRGDRRGRGADRAPARRGKENLRFLSCCPLRVFSSSQQREKSRLK